MSMKSMRRSPRLDRADARRWRYTFVPLMIAITVSCVLASCTPENLVGNAPLPPDVPDPGQTHTAAGALQSYRGALLFFRLAVGGDQSSVVPITGLLTDELRSADVGQQGLISAPILIDSRFLPEYGGSGDDIVTPGPVRDVYSLLQKSRGQAHESRGALLAFMPDGSNGLQGHLDALEGYSDVYLADLFCSGIPLSTLDFGKDFTYAAGSPTADVYQRAISLFDSAQTLAADSDRILNMARVGKGRALLALGKYADAAAAVSSVPDNFQYALLYDLAQSPSTGQTDYYINRSFAYWSFTPFTSQVATTMVDAEGQNGLPFISSGDPRSAFVDDGVDNHGQRRIHPAKYSVDGDSPVVIASGVEARLIQAEAALNTGGGSWLELLNALRTDGSFDTQQNADDASKTDTLWHAGTGGMPGLAPLSDPGDQDARIDLLFRERGFWLFLTGTRQGDLRRLVRQYHRQSNRVYPSGPYPGGYNTYGSDVTAPIPGEERISNPLFAGCGGRGA
jgi:hypothetical protein